MEEEKKIPVDVIDKGYIPRKAESFQGEFYNEKKRKINLEEMILNSTDRQIEDKRSTESKAVGYLAFAALILGMLTDLFPEVINITKNKCSLFSKLCFVFFVLTFVVGVALIIICALILYPKEIGYISPESLMTLYREAMEKDAYDEIDSSLIDGNEDAIPINTATLKKMSTLNIIASVFLMMLISIFIMDLIIYFVFIGA